MSETKVLIIGAKGLLGSTLSRLLAQEKISFATSDVSDENGIDITNKSSIKKILEKEEPTVIVNCAAYTNVEACEDPSEFSKAFAVNSLGPKYLGEICLEKEIDLIHVSTDYVFGKNNAKGYKEDHTPYSPLNKYGESKADGEKNIIEIYRGLDGSNFVLQSPKAYIVRTSALFGEGATNFIAKIMQFAKEKEFLEVVTDEVVSPTYVKDLSEGIIYLIQNRPSGGIYHYSGEGSCTRNEFAKEILKLAKISTPIRPTTLDKFNRKAKIPNVSILSNTKFPDIRTWKEMLEDFMTKTKI